MIQLNALIGQIRPRVVVLAAVPAGPPRREISLVSTADGRLMKREGSSAPEEVKGDPALAVGQFLTLSHECSLVVTSGTRLDHRSWAFAPNHWPVIEVEVEI